LFIGCLGDIGQARCFSAADGSIVWTANVGSTIYDSSPSHADGVVAIGSVIGLLTLMSAANGEILARYQLPPGHFLASPASAPGKVYAASLSNKVVAFEFRAP
jgi:outer membrane protein assembly factor BamB